MQDAAVWKVPAAAQAELTDSEIVARVRGGDRRIFELLMRRHNQRLYRAARAIVRDESDAEDILQQAYLLAYTHLDQFEARAEFSTWLMRILINVATRRLRTLQRVRAVTDTHEEATLDQDARLRHPSPDPEHRAYASELHEMLEDAVDGLPDDYRLVFMLRTVEGLSTKETAEAMGIGEESVKTRLHRGRALLRRGLTARLGTAAAGAFQFQAPRCDRVVAWVMSQLPDASS
jgi:RNA polymerase sigma-70 factor (ECF subfamily)